MELSVADTVNYAAAASAADALGPTLRIFQVAMLDAYVDAVAPADNLTASIPWARASAASVPGMSALCYFFGTEAVNAHPDVPIGMVASSWGGVPIQVYMSPAALKQCGAAAAMPPTAEELIAAARAPGATLADKAAAAVALVRSPGVSATPAKPSCLYFSMFAPLLLTPVSGILWYQGESNAGDPVGYKCLQASMILDWRASWAAVGSDKDLPFAFIQLAGWPTGDSGIVPVMRVAVEDTLKLNKVGMVVAMDVSDPSGAYHPIHVRCGAGGACGGGRCGASACDYPRVVRVRRGSLLLPPPLSSHRGRPRLPAARSSGQTTSSMAMSHHPLHRPAP